MINLLKQVWKYTKKVLLFIGKVQSIILLSLFYYLLLSPIAILFQAAKIFSGKKSLKTYWVQRDEPVETEITLLRQF